VALFKIILKLFAVSLQIMFKKFACVVDNDLPRLTSHVKFGSTELCELRVCRGRNFGLKSGGTDSEFRRRTRRPWVPEIRGKENFGRYFLFPSHLTWVWESNVSSPRGSGQNPSQKMVLL